MNKQELKRVLKSWIWQASLWLSALLFVCFVSGKMLGLF